MSKKNVITNSELNYNSNQPISQSKHTLFKHCYILSHIYNLQIFLCLRDSNNNLSILSTKDNANHFISNYLTFPIQAKDIFNPSDANDFLSNEDDFESSTNEMINSDDNYLATQSYTRSNLTQSERTKKKKYTIKLMFPQTNKSNTKLNDDNSEYDFMYSQNKKNVMLFKKRHNKHSKRRISYSKDNQCEDEEDDETNGNTLFDFHEHSHKQNVHNLKVECTSCFSILNKQNNEINTGENNDNYENNTFNSKSDFDNIFNFDSPTQLYIF